MHQSGKTPPADASHELEPGIGSEMIDCGVLPDTETIHELPVLLILAAVQFLHIVDFMLIMPLGPEFFRRFDITPQQFGFLVTAYTFSAALCSFLVAFVIDRFDRKHALVVFCTGFSIATLLCALSVDYLTLLCSRAVAGMFGGLLSATVFSIIADLIPQVRRGKAMGTVMSAFPFAAVAGMPIGLLLVNTLNWRAPFIMLTVLGFLIALRAGRILPKIKPHGSGTHHQGIRRLQFHFNSIFLNRNHAFAFLLIAMLMFSGYLVIPFISVYMVANVGMQETELPYLYFFGGLFSFFTANLIGRFTDNYGQRLMFCILAILSIVPVLWVTHISEASLYLALTATTLFMVLVTGRVIPLMALITASVRPHLRGSFLTFHMSVQQFSAGLGSLMAGYLMAMTVQGKIVNFDTVGMIAAVITFAGIFLAICLKTVEELDAQ